MKSKLIAGLVVGTISVQSMAWAPAGNPIKTEWTDSITPENVWKSYPRPQLKRQLWQNLNGLWEYCITTSDTDRADVKYQGEILVPFAAESSLSGVHKSVLPTDMLWYSRDFSISPEMKGKNIIMHFGAVDYECTLWLNGKPVGSHKGGNNPFSFDITEYLSKDGVQKIELRVSDPTDSESVTRGKQQLNQKGIWYTPVSGIWKTVWIEAVNKEHITSIRPETDIYTGKVIFDVDVEAKGNESLIIDVLKGGKVLASTECSVREKAEITVPDHKLWTPDSPELYNVRIRLVKGKRMLDDVSSYFAFRKVGIVKDEAGYQRFALNDEIVFQYGTLDQGWWPDGLLTPPCEDAMLWDMVKLKEMGFNTIRKHIKVEPELYYYYADSLGIMIWQDMVSGFATERRKEEHVSFSDEADWNAPDAHTEQWQSELFTMMDQLGFYPCITTWVVFNEGWGQHSTEEIVNKVMSYDKSRVINGVSGWTDRGVGHVYDVHNYPDASMMLAENNGGRVSVLGEFGGIGLPLEGHLWNPEMKNWGYRNIEGAVDLVSDYGRVVYDLETLIAQGLSGAIYTQTTDVEGEVNGLITYDRKVVKIPVDFMNILHSRLYKIAGRQAEVLIPDAQGSKSVSREVEYNEKKMEMAFPARLSGAKVYHSSCTFEVDKPYENLSLWISMPGRITVRLNGHVVFARNVRQTKQYNQYNISYASRYLVKGENELSIELKNSSTKTFSFDYGLRAF